MANPQDQVQNWYKQYLGRDAAPGEVQHWSSTASDPSWAQSAEGGIKGSAEATAYQQKAGAGAQPAPTAPPAPGTQGSPLGGTKPPPYTQWTAGQAGSFNQPPPGGMTPGSNATYQPGTLSSSGINPYQTYNFVPLHGSVPNQQFSQYSGGAAGTAGGNAAAMTALQKVLQDPSGLDTSAMKNRLKEQALFMEQDQKGLIEQGAASRGMSASGVTSGELSGLAGDTRSEILKGFRDIDIADAESRNRNLIEGSAALGNLTSQMTDQEVANFLAMLDGQKAEGEFGLDAARLKTDIAGMEIDDNQFGFNSQLDAADSRREDFKANEDAKAGGADSALRAWEAGNQPWNDMNDRTLEMRKADTTELLGRLGIDVSLEELASKDRQTKMTFIVDVLDLLLRQQQHNQSMGLNYNQLGMDAQKVMQTLVQGLGV